MNRLFITILILVFIFFIGFALWGPKPVDSYISNQNEIEEEMHKEYNEKDRTMNNPYIKVNPYKTNELSAYLAFDNEVPVKYTYEVEGKTEDTSYTYSNSTYTKNPIIPIVGLYPEYNNTVKINYTSKDGKETNKTYKIKTESADIPVKKAKITVENQNTYEKLMKNSAIIDNYSYVYDKNGDLRVSGLTKESWYGYTQEYDGHYLISEADSNGKYTHMYNVNTMGRANPDFVINAPKGYFFAHDAVYAKGKIYALVSPIQKSYTSEQNREADIAVYNKDGKQEDLIQLSDLNKPTDKVVANSAPYDFHLNSVDYYAKKNELILNSRTYSRIYGYNLSTNKVDWIIDNPTTVSKDDQSLELKPVGEIDYPNGEHTVKVANKYLKNEPYYNSDILYLSIYNNRTCTNSDGQEVTKKYADEQGKCDTQSAQGLIYEVDLQNKTYKQVDKIDTPYKSSTTGNFYLNDNYKEIYDSNPGHYLLYDENNNLVSDTFIPVVSQNGKTEDDPFTYRARKINVSDLSDHLQNF